MHAAVTTMAAGNQVPQFPDGGEKYFWQITAEIDILLFLRGAHRSPHASATDSMYCFNAEVSLNCFERTLHF